MGMNLRGVLTKSKKGKFLGGRGGLTQHLIKNLTNFYGLALRNNTEVEDTQQTVMATYYHVISLDAEPQHELCPPGPLSWSRHRSAEAGGKPQPPHKYKLSRPGAEALLPVYKRLSDPQLEHVPSASFPFSFTVRTAYKRRCEVRSTNFCISPAAVSHQPRLSFHAFALRRNLPLCPCFAISQLVTFCFSSGGLQ